ncbi:hypothetical protein TanjilG_03153 [Lupinus angustifolius]|uniref:F-box domain-containing protein n=2 Tax=Lupinus angustifolius TaxID=3871 RepID=A0A4P1RCV6_LUPAN|nr:hypothetical protein TanjilG_03153 [Lupinus angustifolius]
MASESLYHETKNKNTASSTTITAVHPDIIHTHILTRLDGATLSTVASVSSHLRHLCSGQDIWENLCTATWPSLMDPIVRHVISTFPNGHRSIFSDAYPSLHHFSPSLPNHRRPSPPEELISAVDIYYKGNPIFSRVQRTETSENLFLTSPLCFEVLQPNEFIQTPVNFVRKDEEWMSQLQESFTLSWILIDPIQKRAANISSRRPVSVKRHWLTRDLEIIYAVVMAGEKGRSTEKVQCMVKVTCCGKVGGELHVKEVNLVMEDMEGKQVMGKKGVMILQRAMENGERKKVDEVRAMERFVKFSRVIKERREMKHRREKAHGVVCMLLVFIALVLFCFIAGF